MFVNNRENNKSILTKQPMEMILLTADSLSCTAETQRSSTSNSHWTMREVQTAACFVTPLNDPSGSQTT